jgi:hypothetical protein
MRLLSHPFRLTPAGDVATVEDGTEDAAAEALAVLVLTRKGVRELNVAELAVGLIDYGPPGVTIDNVAVTYPSDTLERVELTIRLPEE